MRYGAVSYLNARPLVEGLEPLLLEPPARLVERFAGGGLDVALLPVVAGESAGMTRIGSLGVAAEGPVQSVLLVARRPLDEVATLRLDPESRTSNVLAQVLLGRPEVVDAHAPADAEVVIGDRALVREVAATERAFDLAALWTERTGLPFVFAAWYGDEQAEPALEQAYARGRQKIPAYAAKSAIGVDAPALESYLRERIRYRLGPREVMGLDRFVEESEALGLL